MDDTGAFRTAGGDFRNAGKDGGGVADVPYCYGFDGIASLQGDNVAAALVVGPEK